MKYNQIMDKRKLKFRGGLHKNLIESEVSSQSNLLIRSSSETSETLTSNKSVLLPENVLSTLTSERVSTCQNKTSLKINKSKLCKENTQSRKRKSLSFNAIDSESDEDLGLPLTESTVLKKKRNDTNIPQEECENVNLKSNPRDLLLPTENNIISPTKCQFVEFLSESGIRLNQDAPHVLCKNVTVVQNKMKELLNSDKYEKKTLIVLMERYFENEQNLQNALTDMEVYVNNEASNVLHTLSLIKLLLQVSELHPEIYSSLLSKLNEAVLIADSVESIPWVLSLLQQFRFLDVITNSDALTNSLEQLLESCPIWFQNELLLFLPDIVTDKQHQAVANSLTKVLEENYELMGSILNCMSNLNLGKEYMNEYKEKILNLLKANINVNAIPAIVKFILEDSVDVEVFEKTLKILRDIDMQPLVGEKVDECYQNQLSTINTVKMTMFASKNIVNTTVAVIKGVSKDPKPLDVILLLLVFSMTELKRKSIETIFKQYVRSGFYRISLLSLLYTDYKQVVQEIQSSALELSSNLLKTNERVFIDFAVDWLRLQFMCHKENVFKQREILEKIIFLMGDNEQTVKNALTFLSKMVMKEEERQCLISHCNHLRILLEKVDNLGLEEVGTLNDLLQHLCSNSSAIANALRDDLSILFQKQLSNFKVLIKCKGIMASVMAIKHLMQRSSTSDAAFNLFKTVLKNVRTCLKSKALFYDQLGWIISQTQNIDIKFITNLKDHIEEEFIDTNMTDKTNYTGELVPRFGLNKAEDEPQNCVLTFEDKKYGAIVPISFKLLRTCCIKLSENGDLEAIDSLLGCAILMPENFDIVENFVMDLVICCINWFREVINGFVTQKDPLLQRQVLQRLDNLIYLQTELSIMFSLCDMKYQPPPSYFNYFPTPSFVRIEKKVGLKSKKGKKGSKEKSISLNESDNWELGSLICSRNPTYFRKLDATVLHLLDVDVKLEMHKSQSTNYSVSVKQICFIVKELLGVLDYDANEKFITDLIQLLPKVCSKLKNIAESLRESSNNQNREATRLLLCLLTNIFKWKGFESVTYNVLLRDGLRTIASLVNESNAMLKSCKELVAESCKYFESLSDIATEITLATALVNMCKSLMKHSESYAKQNKEKYAKTAFGFLSLEWPEGKHSTPQFKTAVIELLNNWIDNEPSPLGTITQILEWLPAEAATLKKPKNSLNRIPSVTKSNFHFFFKKIFDGLINGIKITLPTTKRDSERIKIWYQVATSVQKLVEICKTITTKNNILIFLKHMSILLKYFLNVGMPVLEYNLKYQTEDVTKILKMMQGGTRYLHTICCDSAEKKDVTLTKYIPAAKSILEKLIYSVKGMLVFNGSPAAFWMGNLINKNLEGREILSQSVSSGESTLPSTDISDDANNVSSDILESDYLNEDLDDENVP